MKRSFTVLKGSLKEIHWDSQQKKEAMKVSRETFSFDIQTFQIPFPS